MRLGQRLLCPHSPVREACSRARSGGAKEMVRGIVLFPMTANPPRFHTAIAGHVESGRVVPVRRCALTFGACCRRVTTAVVERFHADRKRAAERARVGW